MRTVRPHKVCLVQTARRRNTAQIFFFRISSIENEMRDADTMRRVHRLATNFAPPTFGSAEAPTIVEAHKAFAKVALDALMRNRDHSYKVPHTDNAYVGHYSQPSDQQFRYVSSVNTYQEVVAAGFVTKDMSSLLMPCGSATIRIILKLEQYSEVGTVFPISDDTQITLEIDCLSQSGLVDTISMTKDFAEIRTGLRETLDSLVEQIILLYVHGQAGLGISRF